MVPNRFAFAGLAIACVAAAGVGGYVASRQNAVPAPVAATAAPAPAAVPSPAPSQPVQETEGVVGDVAKAPVDKAAPAKTTKRSEANASTNDKPAAKVSVRENPARSTRSAAAAPAAPTLSSSWPSGSNTQPAAPVPAPESVPAPRAPDPVVDAPHAPDPAQKTFEDLVVSADSVIGLQTEGLITSETARVEDRVEARVSRDVKVGDRVAIPAGSRALGNVTLVERGGKFKERARIGVRFHTLVLADGTRLPISTDPVYREGEPPSQGSAQKIGGAAVGGAILGAILGGAKGAAIGATAGAGGGAAVVAAGDRSNVTLQPGTPLTVRVLSPVTVTIEKN